MTIWALTSHQIEQLSNIIREGYVMNIGLSEETNELIVEYKNVEYKGALPCVNVKKIKIPSNNPLLPNVRYGDTKTSSETNYEPIPILSAEIITDKDWQEIEDLRKEEKHEAEWITQIRDYCKETGTFPPHILQFYKEHHESI